MLQRKFCPRCKYPMLLLSRFEGTSSVHAPQTLGRFANREVFWGTLKMPFFWLTPLENRRRRKRELQVRKLKQRALPIDADAQICPHCLHLEWSFVQL